MTENSTAKIPEQPFVAKRIRLDTITVKNFKAFDKFTIRFPPPRMKDDPDIIVLGSRNGLGKTTILEACSLLFLAAYLGPRTLDMKRYAEVSIDLPDLMIRAGSEEAYVEGTFIVDEGSMLVQVTLRQSGTITIEGDTSLLDMVVGKPDTNIFFSYASETIAKFLGLTSNPFLLLPFMYFHSYRKVQEGRLQLGRLVEGDRLRPNTDVFISIFKLEILRALMSREGLFEDFDPSEAKAVLETLDKLMEEYAKASIGKLKLAPDSTIDFRVIPSSGNNNPSYTFDSLSSGQKEIISTLFLIWRYTQTQPGIVLIDEPELHLNTEWHWKFMRHLQQLAPDNQYIIATHSEDIVAAVDKDRRILLVPDEEEA